MESLLEELQAERRLAADERYRSSMERAEAEHLRRDLERQRAELEDARVQVLNDARSQARHELERLRMELARVRAESGRARLSREQLDDLHRQTRILEERTAPIAPARQRASEVEQTGDQSPGGPLAVGDAVRVRSMNSRGEVVSLLDNRGEAEVQLGPLKMRVAVADLERLSRRQARAPEEPTLVLPPLAERETPGMQLDIRGARVEEALPTVDQYLNDAYLSGMPLVRIVHGKGTGALRQAIREQLAHHPLVKAFAAARNAEGGDGVTEATLAQ
jgi:DNA mismatch repair protein MutS2